MLGGADNPNGELLSYIIGADTALRPVLRRRTFRGYIHDHIPFQSSRGEMYQPQNFLPQASKTFASAPGQLPRDVVSVPRRKGPLRGNPRRPGRQKELRSSGK
ncbi:InsB [Shigella sonnei]|nr:InsB [Shigella sonnei]